MTTALAVLLLLCTVFESAWAAIGYQNYNSAQNGASNTLTINKPSGVAEGDFLLAQITFEKGKDAGTDAQITPSGWTLVRRTNNGTNNNGTDIGQAIFYRFATPADVSGASYTWTFIQAVKAAGGILRYTGVDTASPIVTSTGGTASSGTLTAPGITAQAGSILVAFFGVKKTTTFSNLSAGLISLYSQQNPGNDITSMAAHQTSPTTGNKTATAASVDKWVAQLVELRMATSPEIDVSGNTGFGNVEASSGTVVRTFTINNTGTGSLTLSGSPRVAVSGANVSDFIVTQPTVSSVAASSSTTFQVTFDPSANGVRSATLTIANNDSDEASYTFALQGTGVERLPPTTHLNQLGGASQSCTATTSPYIRNCTVSFTLKNVNANTLQISEYRLTTVSSHAFVLNGTPNPGQVGTVVPGMGSVATNATFQAQFSVGLTAAQSYALRFRVYGYATGVVAAGAEEAQAVDLGEFEVSLTWDEASNAVRILLPFIQR